MYYETQSISALYNFANLLALALFAEHTNMLLLALACEKCAPAAPAPACASARARAHHQKSGAHFREGVKKLFRQVYIYDS